MAGFIDKAISVVIAASFLGVIALAVSETLPNLTGVAVIIAGLITFAYAYAIFSHVMPKGKHGL